MANSWNRTAVTHGALVDVPVVRDSVDVLAIVTICRRACNFSGAAFADAAGEEERGGGMTDHASQMAWIMCTCRW